MARTPEGRRLTEEHKRAQIRLGGLAAALTAKNADRLDIGNLDSTRARWEAAQVAIIEALREQSHRLAVTYLEQFWEAEGMEPEPVVHPVLPPAVESVAWVVPTIKARLVRYAAGG